MPRPASILRDSVVVQDAVTRSGSIKEALRLLGLRAAGGNYRALLKPATVWASTPHVPSTEQLLSGTFVAVPDAVIFCQNSTYTNRYEIKLRLIRSGVPEQCVLCKLGPEWNSAPLRLHLDHITACSMTTVARTYGLLCPNCHSQTNTYAGKTGTRVPCSIALPESGDREAVLWVQALARERSWTAGEDRMARRP